MDPETQHALGAINRRFYAREARAFSETRSAPWPGWEPLAAAPLPPPRSVLDVGCGNARLVDFLDRRWPEPFPYVGCDASDALLARARERTAARPATELVACDLLAEPDTALPRGPFSLVTLFGVLHHIPGADARGALLRTLAERVAPAGVLAVAFWRFAELERFRRRLLPWPEYNASAAEPVALGELEPGDHLLRWGEAEGSVRYCHFVDDAERARLLADLPLVETARYSADGKSGDLNLYVWLTRPEDA